MTTIQHAKLTPTFGFEVKGLDFSEELSSDQIAHLNQLWSDAGGLLLFKNQNMSPSDHVRLTSYFGKVQDDVAKIAPVMANYILPGHPEIYRVSNKKIDGKPMGREDAGTYWHSDGSWMEVGPRGSILHAIELPEVGGDTLFADMTAAYQALSQPMQTMLDGLTATHSVLKAAINTSYSKEYAGKFDQAALKTAVKPVVLAHPVHGKKALYVNAGFTSRITDFSEQESDALLRLLFEHSTRPEFVYRHRWSLSDVVMWDNFSNMHYAVANYKDHGWRLLNRTTVLL